MRQQLAPETFKKVENQSFHKEVAVADESVIADVLDHSTAEELMMLDGQDGTGVDSRDVIFDHSDEKNLKVSFSYAESDGIHWSDQFVQNAIGKSLELGQSKTSAAVEVFFRISSNSKSESEVLHIQKVEFGDDKSLTSSKTRDLELKLPSDGGNACAFDFGENVVPVHLGRSFSKQESEREQSSDYEVKKAIRTDRNQLLMCLSGR